MNAIQQNQLLLYFIGNNLLFSTSNRKIQQIYLPTEFLSLQQRKSTQVNLQKDVISPQKQPSCKKGLDL